MKNKKLEKFLYEALYVLLISAFVFCLVEKYWILAGLFFVVGAFYSVWKDRKHKKSK